MSRRPEAPLFVMALLTYAFFYQAGGWNQNVRLDLTRALVERGTARIDAYADNTGDKACRGPDGRCITARPGVDHYYSDKAPGASWLAAPVWAGVWSMRGAHDEAAVVAVGSHLATVSAIAVPSALGVVALWTLLSALGIAPIARAGVSLAYAFGTLAFPYATLFHGGPLAAALGVIGFALLARRRSDPMGPNSGEACTAGLCLGGAVASDYPAALVALAVAVYAATRPWRERRRVLLGLAIGAAIPVTALAAYHAIVFGGVFTTGYAFSTQPHRGSGLFMGIGAPQPGAVWGLTLSPYRGLFFSAPWLLLALPGWARLWRHARAEAAVCLVGAAGLLALNVALLDWQGGWAPGPRYLVPSLPLWAVAAAGIFLPRSEADRGENLAWLGFGASAAVSVFLMLVATAVGPEVSERIPRPFGEQLLPRFFEGALAQSTQSFQAIHPAPGGPARAWNAGQRLGLSGLASLLPLAAIWMAGAVWLGAVLRRRPPAPD